MKQINIGCASNNNYAQHLGIMIYSLLKNCSEPKRVRFFIADGGISEENLKKISGVIDRFGAKAYYFKPDKKMFKGIRIYEHFGIETYYRFFLLESTCLDKLLYLDCDLVVEADIKKLYDLDLKNELLMAVVDPGIGSKEKERIGLTSGSPYFNAGVLLINCALWKKYNITKKAIKFLRENKQIEFPDQDALNFILRGKWKKLPLYWNVVSRLMFYNLVPFKKIAQYSSEEINEAIKSPRIIHYASRLVKPWFFFDPSPFKSRYWFYLKQSPWADYKYPDLNFKGLFSRLSNYLSVIPKLIR
jgi:lipopolysaccharide biosynthesis glycosyltransferase